ncbi:unnamed protein product [Schistosoma mattheei]|uniref:Uncharacterized protein n=1 Tax=Schistosoma mattheei TaxID=31246 RepID=A0A3P8FA44_9TREM|nr:unnamed protein product [Schistosoma mattheei]
MYLIYIKNMVLMQLTREYNVQEERNNNHRYCYYYYYLIGNEVRIVAVHNEQHLNVHEVFEQTISHLYEYSIRVLLRQLIH